MLTLTRKVNEDIRIGDDIVIRVVAISPSGRVKLGIEAPRGVSVHRKEIYERIKRQNARTSD